MDRRAFLLRSSTLVASGIVGSRFFAGTPVEETWGTRPPAYSVIPVVGDGRWIWTAPPEGKTGYLEPRDYELKLGVQLEGTGPATQLKATTVAPVELPEQKVIDVQVQTQGGQAGLRQLADEAGQLLLVADGIQAGQVINAVATYRVRLHKEYRAFTKDRFPAKQQFSKQFQPLLFDSPGIQTRFEEVKKLAASLSPGEHPWDRAKAFHQWVWENIKPRPGQYTSVVAALRDHVGDCEEKAAVFVALCRVAGIPSRLVWVPNHNWAEFCLNDEQGQPQWIPAHTSCYQWFGWTGAHELVLQKGDRIFVPEKRQPQRLLADWAQWQGAKPKIRWAAELTPLPMESNADIGPGHRRKDEKGEWLVVGRHELDPYLRDGDRAGHLKRSTS